ncbi:hypothetical protein JMJ78_0003343 [Colletotrichum scovillei]|nr:hypothetical protein JMJ78_0003343 [Colletotrichum scovillei]
MHVAYVWRLPPKSSAITNIKSPHGDEEQWLCGLRSSHGRLVSGQSGTAAGVVEDKLRSSMRLLKANPVDPPTRFVPRIPRSMEDSHFLRGRAFEFLNRPTAASHLVEPLYTTLRAVLRRDEQRSSFRLPRRNSPTCYPYKGTFADISATDFWWLCAPVLLSLTTLYPFLHNTGWETSTSCLETSWWACARTLCPGPYLSGVLDTQLIMPPRRPSARLPAAKPTDVESKSAGLCYREQPSNATFESKSPHSRYCSVRYLVQNGIAALMAVIVQRLPIAATCGILIEGTANGANSDIILPAQPPLPLSARETLGTFNLIILDERSQSVKGKPCEDPATQLAENECLLLQLFAMNISRAYFTGYSVVPLSDWTQPQAMGSHLSLRDHSRAFIETVRVRRVLP